MIFCCMDMPYFVLFIHSSTDGHLGCFHLLDVMNSAAVNIHVQVFGWTGVFFSLEYAPQTGIVRSCGNYGESLEELPDSVPK